MPDNPEFSFTIHFTRGQGDPRRIFDAVSLLIKGFEELGAAVTQPINAELAPTVVLETCFVSGGEYRTYRPPVYRTAHPGRIGYAMPKSCVGNLHC
jgi:hypothetical protein